jgi:hypothetical protein
MELLLTYILLEGILIYSLNKIKVTEKQVLERWKRGNLSYEDVLALRKSRYFLLRKLNKKVKIGKTNKEKKDD